MSTTKKQQRPTWRDGAAARGDIEILREEVRDCRDLLWAVLKSLGVPDDRIRLRMIDGSVANHTDRRRGRGVVGVEDLPMSGKATEEARNRYDIDTLVDLVREVPRSEVAVWPGMGKIRMSKLDAVVADAGLQWADEEVTAR